MIENLNIKKQSVRAIRVMGIEEYSQTIEKKVKEFKKKRERIKRKIIYTKQVNLG